MLIDAGPVPTETETEEQLLQRDAADEDAAQRREIPHLGDVAWRHPHQAEHEDRVQAKAALLPQATLLNGFDYTQPNGPDNSIIFVTNDGPKVFNQQINVHADAWAPGKRADYQMSIAAEAIARAKVEIAVARGKQVHDKRQDKKTAEAQREIRRVMKERH